VSKETPQKHWELPLADIHNGLRSKCISARSLAELAIARYQNSEGRLNSYRSFDESLVRQQADAADRSFTAGLDRGFLQGIPISVKDLFGVKGFPIFAGSNRELPIKWHTEGPIIEEVRRHESVIMGKSHSVEFAIGALGTNPNWGTPRNPWDNKLHRIPGGSSSGAGVSLAQGSALVALGSDTAGSIRVPASMTGVVGYKPTFGKWPTEGIIPLSNHLDCPGPLTRSVVDLVFLLKALAPAIQNQKSDLSTSELGEIAQLRIGVCDQYFWDNCSPGVADGVQKALAELEEAGAQLADIDITLAADAMEFQLQGSLVGPEFATFIEAELPAWVPLLDPSVRARLEQARKMPNSAFNSRINQVKAFSQQAANYFCEFDVLALPTTSVTPPSLDEIAQPESYRENTKMALRNTCVANLCGLAAITLPVALDRANMPVGLQFMAANGEDSNLIRAAAVAENILGTGAERIGRPPLGY